MKADWIQYDLIFKNTVGTSRGSLSKKPSYYLRLIDDQGKTAFGECSLLPGLSIDDKSNYTDVLNELCEGLESNWSVNEALNHCSGWPSIAFGLEMALAELDLLNLGNWQDLPFERGEKGIPINGLIWMGSYSFQQQQLHSLVERGFNCIKFKIGKDFWEEGRALLQEARKLNPSLELRVDANGAYSFDEARKVLKELKKLEVHSIEQPIAVGQWSEMATLVKESPIPIALDEELIFCPTDRKAEMLKQIQPHYIILKPSLLGGWRASEEWIYLAKKQQIKFWTTSALESQLGLQWIARFAALNPVPMAQGLGTGSLYSNNLASDLEIVNQALWRKKGEIDKVEVESLWPK